ncbi:MAG: hypothetical protein NXH88_12955 [Hyphomonas sp.]|nr:hypothetical protein [Hyphomonas sp.]
MASLDIHFTAYPHNLEFMVRGQKQHMLSSHQTAFAAEMHVYRKAHMVRTISSFDALVLQSLGVDSVDALPYQPPNSDVAELALIREQRGSQQRQKPYADSFILILGSAGNPPTREGFERLLEIIADHEVSHHYIVAGFGTEILMTLAPQNVDVLGEVNDGDLRRLMVTCDALLVYQPPTSGMLTRIVEAALAGIPTYVLGGYLQAKELQNEEIHSIRSLDELP